MAKQRELFFPQFEVPVVPFDTPAAAPDFQGSDYVRAHDHLRLGAQILRVAQAMQDGQWRTLGEIAQITSDPEASVSAQLRHLRKPKFGEHTVEKRARGDRDRGCFEYRLIVNARLC